MQDPINYRSILTHRVCSAFLNLAVLTDILDHDELTRIRAYVANTHGGGPQEEPTRALRNAMLAYIDALIAELDA